MTNAWSLLYDELKMDNYKHSEHYYDQDRNRPFSADMNDTIIGTENNDTITFGAAQSVPFNNFIGGMSEDTICFNTDTFSIDLDMPRNNNYKYSEEKILKELSEYINGTYNQHYSAGDDKIQTLDLIEACGDGEAFCRSNILKYASRYDKKGTARRDIMKILHYAVLLMHFNDKNAQRETYPQ